MRKETQGGAVKGAIETPKPPFLTYWEWSVDSSRDGDYLPPERIVPMHEEPQP